MADFSDILSKVRGWVKDFVNLGLVLVLLFLVIDLLLGPQTDIVLHMAEFIDGFLSEGVIGLIIFIIVLAIYQLL